jgi:hypothetical protein
MSSASGKTPGEKEFLGTLLAASDEKPLGTMYASENDTGHVQFSFERGEVAVSHPSCVRRIERAVEFINHMVQKHGRLEDGRNCDCFRYPLSRDMTERLGSHLFKLTGNSIRVRIAECLGNPPAVS